MKKYVFDVSKISLDTSGRLELGDEELRKLESSQQITTAGGDFNWDCDGSFNGACENVSCTGGGTTNTDFCVNDNACWGANNQHACR